MIDHLAKIMEPFFEIEKYHDDDDDFSEISSDEDLSDDEIKNSKEKEKTKSS